MSNSESHISIITMASNSDSESMDYDNMTVVGNLVAYLSPEAVLRVSHRHMNAVKEG